MMLLGFCFSLLLTGVSRLFGYRVNDFVARDKFVMLRGEFYVKGSVVFQQLVSFSIWRIGESTATFDYSKILLDCDFLK